MAAVNQTLPEKSWSSRLLERRRLTDSTFELRLSRPPDFNFKPGQRIALQVDRTERDYTLVSAPTGKSLSVLVRRIPRGRLTPFLDQVPIGDRLSFTGPEGHFLFHPGQRPAVMVATGTGIAPFTAMIRAGAKPTLLLHGVRSRDELYYHEELKAAVRRYVPCLSTEPSVPAEAFNGYVTHFLQTRLDPISCDFYLAGRMEMIHDAMQIIDHDFPSSRIYSETFF